MKQHRFLFRFLSLLLALGIIGSVGMMTVFAEPEDGQEQQEVYVQMCDSIAEAIDSGIALEDAGVYRDGDNVGITYFIPFRVLFSDSVYGIADPDMAGLDAAPEILPDPAAVPDNIQRMSSSAATEDFFRSQLTTSQRDYFDKAKKAMVVGNSNSVNYTGFYHPDTQLYDFMRAVCALIVTYPEHFDWMDRGKGGVGYDGVRTLFSYNVKFYIKKSKYYSSSLASKAKKKTQELTDAAYAYAEKNYPDAPSYGIVKYFHDWICANAEYNMDVLGEDDKTLTSKEFFYSHCSFGVLLEGYGVCESYALVMSRLLDSAGVPNLYVVGDAGGGHAWNYVQMPNEKWYMMDTTWDDSQAGANYFLSADDKVHTPTGLQLVSTSTSSAFFQYPARASAKYTFQKESVSFGASAIAVGKGKKVSLTRNEPYYNSFRCTWTSSDPKTAKVDKKGNIKCAKPGSAVVSCQIAGLAAECTVNVYQWSGLKFEDSNKAALSTSSYAGADTLSYTIQVGQKNGVLKASELMNMGSLKEPSAVSKNASIAAVTSCTLSGDAITLKVQPLKAGTAKIAVTFDGKKANLTLRVAEKGISEKWFDLSAVKDTAYTGKAIKPKIIKSANAPSDLKFKVSYLNNKAAGNASVIIEGKGKYGGTVKRNFLIKD